MHIGDESVLLHVSGRMDYRLPDFICVPHVRDVQSTNGTAVFDYCHHGAHVGDDVGADGDG